MLRYSHRGTKQDVPDILPTKKQKMKVRKLNYVNIFGLVGHSVYGPGVCILALVGTHVFDQK